MSSLGKADMPKQSRWGQPGLDEGSVPLDLVLGSLDIPDIEHHQAHIDGIGGDANDAEIIEHEEQDPG